MMTILAGLGTFFKMHWLDLVVLIIFLVIMAMLWKAGRKKAVISIIRSLVAKAEQQYGSRTGPVKWNAVYAALPMIVRMLFTQEELGKLINDAVRWLDDQLARQEANLLTHAQEVQIDVLSEDFVDPYP